MLSHNDMTFDLLSAEEEKKPEDEEKRSRNCAAQHEGSKSGEAALYEVTFGIAC